MREARPGGPLVYDAILEGSAFALRDIITAMRNAGLTVQRITAVGGGVRSALWRQIKADVTGLPVRVPRDIETTAVGAAIVAVLALALDDDVNAVVERFVSYEPTEHDPDPARMRIYEDTYSSYRDCYSALNP